MTHPASNYSLRFSLFRHQGIIPARRHDAFLLSLLLALLVNIIFFTLQAILPAIIFLLTLLGANPAPRLEEEKELPFILVDPSELVTSVDNPEAMGEVSREERQTEATPEAEDLKPRIDEGVEEILSLLPGNPALSLDGGEAGMESAPPPPPPPNPPAGLGPPAAAPPTPGITPPDGT
ncbi:MAG: hypothetical protein LBU79_09910, partial [Planctomycetota bacterium]|nr:hypothetical protein [Planctomycetota bacterium]